MKRFKHLFLILFVALFITGCGAKPEQVIKKASQNMNKLDNYHLDLTVSMKMAYEETNFNIDVKTKSDIDVKNQKEVTETSTSLFGMESTEKSYLVVKDGKSTTYTYESDQWYKEDSDESLNFDFDILANATTVEKLEDEKNTYKVVLSEEQLKKLLDGTTEDDTEYSNVDIKVTVKDKYITNMVISMVADGSECTFTLEFSKFNDVSVSIPQEAIDQAIYYDFEV